MTYKLSHIKIDDTWYWKCSCGKLFVPHKKLDGQRGVWQNFQSKGAASRHLMTHDKNLVKHGRSIGDATYMFHKFKLTKEEKECLLKNKTIQVERKGLFSPDHLAVDEKGDVVDRIYVVNEISRTYEKYPHQDMTNLEHI